MSDDEQRLRDAIDKIADALDLPIDGDEPIVELAERCVAGAQELARREEAEGIAAAVYRAQLRKQAAS